MKKFIVVDETDAYAVSVGIFEGEEAMLDAVQYKEPGDLSVYEYTRKVKLVKRPSIVLDMKKIKNGVLTIDHTKYSGVPLKLCSIIIARPKNTINI